MKPKKQTRIAVIITTIIFCMMFGNVTALANDHVPYDTYNYDYRDYIVHTPAAYVPDNSITGVSFGIGAFNNPQDLCIAPDGLVYLADTNNNRIVVLNDSMTKLIKVIKEFDNNGTLDTFNRPFGVAISNKNELYIADSENKRIVVLDANDKLIKIVSNPQSDVLEAGYVFTPLKVTVDYADRIFCIAKGMTEGIMVFDSNGQFTSFYGTIKVEISLWEKIWRKLSTKKERSRQSLFIPTEFTGIDIDEKGFVFASNIDNQGVQAVRRLNPSGEDVIKKGVKKNVGGDLMTGGMYIYSGPSKIVDVAYRDNGIYSILDSRRGRIFTYDSEGNLLYIFGGLGSQAGTFVAPVAIESLQNKILVLDATRAEILVFNATEYGTLINEAVALRFDGDEALAVEKWEKVLKLDENFEIANVGIGKAYLSKGDNEMAMKYLKLGMSREYYSIAYKRYRNEILKDNISYILTGIVIIAAGVMITKKVLRRRKNIQDDTDGGGLE